MYSLKMIERMNRETAKKAKGKKPYIAKCDNDLHTFRNCPNFGDYRPAGYKLVDSLFVDNSGFGGEGESALTASQFLLKIEKGKGYAIIETGQFQIYVGVFEKC